MPIKKCRMQLVFHNAAFSFQLLRIIGQTYYGGADIGECLSNAYRIELATIVYSIIVLTSMIAKKLM